MRSKLYLYFKKKKPVLREVTAKWSCIKREE